MLTFDVGAQSHMHPDGDGDYDALHGSTLVAQHIFAAAAIAAAAIAVVEFH